MNYGIKIEIKESKQRQKQRLKRVNRDGKKRLEREKECSEPLKRSTEVQIARGAKSDLIFSPENFLLLRVDRKSGNWPNSFSTSDIN